MALLRSVHEGTIPGDRMNYPFSTKKKFGWWDQNLVPPTASYPTNSAGSIRRDKCPGPFPSKLCLSLWTVGGTNLYGQSPRVNAACDLFQFQN